MVDGTIVAHHVGARGFGVALNTPPVFDDDIAHVLFEADAACANAMRTENQRKNVFVLPYCLGERDVESTLYITANPYASSLLPPSPEYGKYYCEVMLSGELDHVNVQGTYYDALYSTENEVVATQPVRMRSLDSLANEGVLPLGRLPDFLSLDTQGSEHAILRGAREVISRSVLAIATEIEFHPMYQGQPLFSAILDLANECGFHFAGFTYLQEISPHRAPVGQRAKGFVAFGDAIFLRSLETLASMCETPEDHSLKALKLAFISSNFGYLEYGLQALEQAAQRSGVEVFADPRSAPNYLQFLKSLRCAAAEMPQLYLNSKRGDLVEQLRATSRLPSGTFALPNQQRFSSFATLRERLRTPAERLGHAGRRIPALRTSLISLVSSARLCGRVIRRVIARIKRSGARSRSGGSRAATTEQFARSNTPIETVLGDYGFYWIRDEVRRRRLTAQPFLSTSNPIHTGES